MVYFADSGMTGRFLWMMELTSSYDGFVYAKVNESMLEQGYIVIEDFYWRDTREGYMYNMYFSPDYLKPHDWGMRNTTYYCPARYNITWKNAVQVWQVYNLTLPWRPWGLATTVTVAETVTTTLPASTVTTTTTYTTTETIAQTTTETTTLPPVTITTVATEREAYTTTVTATRAPVETVATGALGALIGALVMALLLRKPR
jgi:hypothetical protein